MLTNSDPLSTQYDAKFSLKFLHYSPNVRITRMVRVTLPPPNSAHIYIDVNCILIKKEKIKDLAL